MAIITLDHVSKIFGNGEVGIKDLSINIEAGEFIFFIGSSGAGKSTLLKLMTKQMDISSGSILIEGTNLKDIKDKKLPHFRRMFGILGQDSKLLGDLTVYDNIALAMYATQQPLRLIHKRVPEVLGMVGMRNKASDYASGLSGGEAARVLLARAIAPSPRILIVDEPTANLDADTAWDIMYLLGEINRLGITILMATHARDLVNFMRKRVITLIDGNMVEDMRKGLYNDKALDAFDPRHILEQMKLRR